MKFAVITFPGSNGEHDALMAIELGLGFPVEAIWYKEQSLDGFDCVLLPGGFSYGDYLRPGAIARFAPIMREVERFARGGGPVLGICNGFQVLVEAGLLPGALLRNESLQFRCQWVYTRVESSRTPWTAELEVGSVLRLPVAHGDGQYFATPDLVNELERNDQIVFRYTDAAGERGPGTNLNGSVDGIAGVCNAAGNVVGLMPHPERAYSRLIGGDDGLKILSSVLRAGVSLAV